MRASKTNFRLHFAAFEQLPRDAKPVEAHLDSWIERYPRSYAARLTRGIYRFHCGAQARGEANTKDTARENFKKMADWFDKAREDLQVSLGLAAKPLIARVTLMAAAMRSGTKTEIDQHYRSAIAYAPGSISLRTTYMQNLEPRWGGSEEQMAEYAARSRIELGDTAAADRLDAMIFADHGQRSIEAKHYEPAYAALSRAIALADRPYYRCVRAYAAYRVQKQAEMLADLRAALTGRPYAEYCGDTAAAIVEQNAKLENAFEIIEGFLQQDPDHVRLLNQRGWLRKQRGDMANAYQDFARAAELGDAWAQTMAGKYLFNGWGVAADRERGLSMLRLAAEQGEPNARLSVVQALQTMGRNEEAAREQARYATPAGAPPKRSVLESLSDVLTPLRAAGLLAILLALLLGLRWWRARR